MKDVCYKDCRDELLNIELMHRTKLYAKCERFPVFWQLSTMTVSVFYSLVQNYSYRGQFGDFLLLYSMANYTRY